MSDDIKKLLSIMKESTTAGAIAPTAGAMGNSMLKRPTDTIFAAEEIDPEADTGLEESPKVDSPSNYALWKNSALIGEEQYGNHGRKKMKMDKTKMYPQKLGESFQKDDKDEEDTFTSNEKISKGNEQNAGLNEPDEFKPDFGGDKSGDFGTWHFKFESGNIVKKDGKPLLASSMKNAQDIVDHASKRGVTIEIVDGAPEDKQLNELSPKTLASYKKKAGKSASEADKRGDFAKGHQRFKGINKATQRELDNGAKGVAEDSSDAGAQDMAAAEAEAANAKSNAETQIADAITEAEITEEMIADRLKNELALFKKGTKAKDKAISKKPADKEVQPKKPTKKEDE